VAVEVGHDVAIDVKKLEAFAVVGDDVSVPDGLEERVQWLSLDDARDDGDGTTLLLTSSWQGYGRFRTMMRSARRGPPRF
jgi:hypothetical protein